MLETSHPPVYYLPRADIVSGALEPCDGSSWCEFKGRAQYWSVVTGDTKVPRAAWSYPEPTPQFASLRDHVAFYASKVDECWVGEERASAQEGDFYGGWITSWVRGPFKGAPGTRHW